MVPSEIVRWWLQTAEPPNLRNAETPKLRITGRLSHRTQEAPKVVRRAPEIVLGQAAGQKVMWASSRGCEVARGCWASEVWVATRRYWDAYKGTGRNVGASGGMRTGRAGHLQAVGCAEQARKGGVPLTIYVLYPTPVEDGTWDKVLVMGSTAYGSPRYCTAVHGTLSSPQLAPTWNLAGGFHL
ncbi:hypothetical protein GGX14DRAFT_405313 [Mycena pura]|uniref:Uncharacterized protein n=1 Tax=Mycena pura TaxID=153505 RepID=A0AAD6UWF7_9AGAR|nr:hypothetical protein GGX14DRAFT_405313 [Mycena pura]